MRAQGTIEYLVILAVIVVISLIVVSLMINSTTPSSTISQAQSKLYWKSQPIRINEAAADSEGDLVLSISPQETLTIETITIDGVEKDVTDTKVFGGSTQIILLTGLIECSGESGSYTINSITGTSENGLPVIISEAPIIVECTEDISEESIIEGSYIEAFELGSLQNPIIINTCLELQDVNSQLDANYVLGQNIDCYTETQVGGSLYNSGAGFYPIGLANDFTGSLDGAEYDINGLFINRTSAAGLFAENSGTIEDLNIINLEIIGGEFTAGLVGSNYGTILNSSTSGTISGTRRVGGFVGYNQGTITKSFSTANVNGSEVFGRTGGFVGYNVGGIWDSYAQGSVTSNGSAGGFIGHDYNFFGLGVHNSYSTGLVNCSFSCGGFIGTYDSNPPSGVESSYYDSQTSGIGSNLLPANFTGDDKTTIEMQQQATFVGWDFANIWQICEGTTYPFLQREGRTC